MGRRTLESDEPPAGAEDSRQASFHLSINRLAFKVSFPAWAGARKSPERAARSGPLDALNPVYTLNFPE